MPPRSGCTKRPNAKSCFELLACAFCQLRFGHEHGSGFSLVQDDDITESTLSTYAAMRRIYREAGIEEGVRTTDRLEMMTRRRFIRFRVLAFEREA